MFGEFTTEELLEKTFTSETDLSRRNGIVVTGTTNALLQTGHKVLPRDIIKRFLASRRTGFILPWFVKDG
jgi:hypothetical protein